MNLLQVREQFVRQSGRYDLVVSNTTSSWNDNGADFYIQAGQRMLDRMLPFPKDEGELSVSLATGGIASTITGVRAVRRVVLVDSVENKMKTLEKSDISSLRTLYGGFVSLASTDVGEPVYWALGTLRKATVPTTTTEAYGLKLVTMPPADQTYELKPWCLLESQTLSNDTSVSYWSTAFPEVLIQAALYQVEVAYRNYEGSRAILAEIQEAVERISNENVEQSLQELEVLKDSHRFTEDVRGKASRHSL